MAVVTVKSTAITNADAMPRVQNTQLVARGVPKISVGVAAVANGDSIASQYRLARIRSGDRLTSLLLFCGAITSAAANVGLYTVNGGAAVSASLFAAAQSIAAAQNTGLELVHSVTTLANAEKRIWELLGLSADPGLEYDVVLTLTAAATAAGSVKLQTTTVTNG